jgi:hypothetical protein
VRLTDPDATVSEVLADHDSCRAIADALIRLHYQSLEVAESGCTCGDDECQEDACTIVGVTTSILSQAGGLDREDILTMIGVKDAN